MKTSIFIVLIISTLLNGYPYTIPYYNEEFFLYPILNYEYSNQWKKDKERKLYSGNIFQTSYGSLTTRRFMSNEELIINYDLNSKFIFRLNYIKRNNRHLSYNENILSAGFGYKINGYLTVLTSSELSDNKSKIDIQPGLLLELSENYFFAGINFQDVLYESKSLERGTNNNLPVNIVSNMKINIDRFYFFTSLNHDFGFERVYPADWYYAPLLSHKHSTSRYSIRSELKINDKIEVYIDNLFDIFSENKWKKNERFWDIDSSSWVEYEPEISKYEFRSVFFYSKLGIKYKYNDHLFDCGTTYASTDHDFDLLDGTGLINGHNKSYVVNYSTLMPFFKYKFKVRKNIITELSYMGCYTAYEDENNFHLTRPNDPQSYWDKELIKAGLEYRFNDNCSLYLSAGQLINTGVFGGGNARLNLMF